MSAFSVPPSLIHFQDHSTLCGAGASTSSSADSSSTQPSESNILACRQCGSTELDSDTARGDTVCTNCGYVLEESLIVSEICFQENGHGGASAIGQFISADSKGGGGIGLVGAGSGHHNTHLIAKESREVTLRTAKRKIVEIGQQLRLNQHCIDMSFNFFKMALHKQLTKGRKHPLTLAACTYMTCRIEGTPHLLIDFSDIVQMDIYALGRTFIHLSRSLYINIPAIDPCLYILRFAYKFDLGEKTHEVSMTALRLVQRMKRDWIHLGRRPSGLCGAALLIAARLHGFSRKIQDVIRVVKVHETTLRKRLVEFGETPSSSLTIEEFMSVDLEEEHDPPSFKSARVKDREEFVQKLFLEEESSNLCDEMSQLQTRIDEELQKRRKPKTPMTALEIPNLVSGNSTEVSTATRFVMESTMSTINTVLSDVENNIERRKIKCAGQTTDLDRMLMPPPPKTLAIATRRASRDLQEPATTIETSTKLERRVSTETEENAAGGELDLTGINDEEIDSYLMSETEAERKRVIWEQMNHDYLVEQEVKRKRYEEDLAAGKFDKKRKRTNNRNREKSVCASGVLFQAKTANEAIKIMLTERKMSSKINYDVLKKLAFFDEGNEDGELTVKKQDKEEALDGFVTVIESGAIIPRNKRNIKTESAVAASESEGASTSSSRKRKKIKKERRERHKEDTESTEQSESSCQVHEDEQERIMAGNQDPVIEDVVIESGPVETTPSSFEGTTEDGELEEYYEEGDEEVIEEDTTAELSARELLTQFRGDQDFDDEEDEYY